jgi:hypothetical protein
MRDKKQQDKLYLLVNFNNIYILKTMTGSRRPYTKLTDTEKQDIRDLYSRYDFTCRELAKFFKVGKSTICDIVNSSR